MEMISEKTNRLSGSAEDCRIRQHVLGWLRSYQLFRTLLTLESPQIASFQYYHRGEAASSGLISPWLWLRALRHSLEGRVSGC
jgi:hypothetical protein